MKPTTVWISVLIPSKGADVYQGVRVQASLSNRDCYYDLAVWLGIPYRGVRATREALDHTDEVRLWKVERQEIYQGGVYVSRNRR